MIIGIVGLGLIGGSMAQAIKKYTDHTVIATNRSYSIIEKALDDKAIDAEMNEVNLGECDLLFLALYPKDTIEYIEKHADKIKRDCCIIDLCGVKRFVCDVITPISLEKGFHFVGGHPMAGREVSGYDGATPDLFVNASMILTPHPEFPQHMMSDLVLFFRTIQFEHVQLADPMEHDRMISYTSQLAHVLSNAYVRTEAALKHKGFSAGSFQDLTRVAKLNATMWTELFFENKDFLIADIDALCERLSEYSRALKAEDAEKLHALLQEGTEWKKRTL